LPSDNPLLRLADVLENIERIWSYTQNYTFDRFASDSKFQDAVERCLLRISETARKLQGVAEVLVPGQPWSDIRAVGNVLRHDYAASIPTSYGTSLRTILDHCSKP
jgi:uncharacterized protein with HEPN domain